MEISSIALLAILFMAIVIAVYLDMRDDRVYAFSKHIIDCSHDEIQRVLYEDIDRGKQLLEQFKKIYDQNTYDRMLYSIKPLKVKYWFTEEEIRTFNLTDL